MADVLRTRSLGGDGFLRREILGLGYDDSAIARLVRSGDWVRIRHGAYFHADVWKGLDEIERHRVRARVVTRAARVPHVLSHTTALLHHTRAIWDLDLSEVHVTRTDERSGRVLAGVRQHRGVLAEEDVVDLGGVRVTSVARSALELTTVTDTERSLIVLDDLLRRGLTTREELEAMCRRMTYWPKTLATDLAIRLSDPRSESPGETRFRYLCWRMGLPAPQLQVEIRDGTGRVVARVDFAWPQFGVFAEFDGLLKYAGDPTNELTAPAQVVVREKQREDLVRRLTGWRCLRFLWPDLDRPDRTADVLWQAFASGRPGNVA
jgi:Transcriptional regulator, AbiEi antitoxin